MRTELATALAVLALAVAAPAATFEVQRFASVRLSGARLELGCADLSIAGTLNLGDGFVRGARHVSIVPGGTLLGGSGRVTAAGDWTNAGSFAAGTGTVELFDGCGARSAAIRGTNTFATLWASSSTGKTLSFQAGATQTVTGALLLTGVPGNRLLLRSTVDGALAFLDLRGSQLVSSVDVKDNHALGAPIQLDQSSVLSGNTAGWLFGVPVPALPAVGLLAAALGALAAWRSRNTPVYPRHRWRTRKPRARESALSTPSD